MKHRTFTIIIVILAVAVLAFLPTKSEYEKELEYYKAQGCEIYLIDPVSFYSTIPTTTETKEIEVSRTTLRNRVSQVAIESGIKVVFTDGKSIWTGYFPTERDDYIHICVWTP